MIEVFASYFQEEVIVIRSLLDSAGIASEILDGSMGEFAPFYSIDSGGFRLLVAEGDAEDSAALVADHRARRAAAALPDDPVLDTPVSDDPVPGDSDAGAADGKAAPR